MVNKIDVAKKLKDVEDLTMSSVSYLTGLCPDLDAVGEATLCLGREVNDSDNKQAYQEAAWITKHVLSRSAEDAFEVQYLPNGRFTYPKATGFGQWQVRLSPESVDLIDSGWYLARTAEEPLSVCSETVAEEVVFFRGFFFKAFQYGHVLHDLLPMLIWMSASHPKARVFLELDTHSKIRSFLEWFDPDLYNRTTFVHSGYVVCAGALWLVVPQAPSPHGLRIPALFNNLRRHIAKVQPTFEARSTVYALRLPSTAGHGRLLTEEHSQEVVQTAQSALLRHGRPSEIIIFNGTSNGKKTATFREQYQIFSSAVLVFGPHGTAFSNILWMPCAVPVAAIEFICGAHSLKVRGCELPDGNVRLATYFSLEGSISWVTLGRQNKPKRVI